MPTALEHCSDASQTYEQKMEQKMLQNKFWKSNRFKHLTITQPALIQSPCLQSSLIPLLQPCIFMQQHSLSEEVDLNGRKSGMQWKDTGTSFRLMELIKNSEILLDTVPWIPTVMALHNYGSLNKYEIHYNIYTIKNVLALAFL